MGTDTLSVRDALDAARDRWARAGLDDYRLTVTEGINAWSQGCSWASEVHDGTVIDTADTGRSASGAPCPGATWTVGLLHDEAARMIAEVARYDAPEFGDHTLDVVFDDAGVPVSIRYDLANGDDEESLLTVFLTPRTSPVVTAQPSDAIEEALITGTLVLRNGCLYIDGDEGGLRVAVLKAGTAWDVATSSVVNTDGTAITVGQRFSASGGGHRVGGLDGLVDGDAATRAESCADAADTSQIDVVGYLSPA